MGSTVIAYPSIQRMITLYPNAELFFLIFKKNEESVSLLNIIPTKNILTIRDNSSLVFFLDTMKYILFCLNNKIDTVFDLELFSRVSTILSYCSRAQVIVGFHKHTAEGLYRGSLLTHNVYYNDNIHMVYNFYALTEACAGNHTWLLKKEIPKNFIKLPRVDFNSNRLKYYKDLLGDKRKILVLNPNSGPLLPIRNWGVENFADVACYAEEKLKMKIIVVGLADAKLDAAYILSRIRNKNSIIDLTGKTESIYDLLHVFQISDIFLTNDSGSAHFAALTDIYNLVIFGPETPGLYKPLSSKTIPIYSNYLCSPCLTARNHRNTLCKDNLCQKSITPEKINNLLDQLVREAENGTPYDREITYG